MQWNMIAIHTAFMTWETVERLASVNVDSVRAPKLSRICSGGAREHRIPSGAKRLNVLEISIAVCLEQVVVDKILRFEVLNGPNQDETVVNLALIASALKACTDKLKAEYDNRVQTSERAEEDAWHLPCPSATAPPNALFPELKFKAKLTQSNDKLTKLKGKYAELRSLFLATYHDREVVVKFAVIYNDSAHIALAKQNYAPTLRLCEQVIGGLKMVAINRVHGKPMYDEGDNSLPRSVFEDLEKAPGL
ncbi:hypothetical protein ACEPAF_2971 [Sanghuangporus sanghuang]